MFKMTLLVVLLLTAASSGQEPCSDADQNCKPLWSLQTNDGAALAQVSEGVQGDLVSPNEIDTAMISFQLLNQSASPEVQDIVARNDSVKIIELSANDIDNNLLSYNIISLPLHGKISGNAPNIIYMPESGFVGTDSFVVSASSASGPEKNVTVSIDVVSLPHSPNTVIREPPYGEVFTIPPDQTRVTIPVRATSTGDVQSIKFYDYATLIGSGNCEDASGRCPVTIFPDFIVGTHVLTARAVSAKYGNSCPSLPVVIIVNPSQPAIRITSPLPGQIFTVPKTITITAEVTDSKPVSRVEFYANSQMIWSSTESKSLYRYDWIDAKPGVYNIVVKAMENPNDPNTIAISKPVLIVVVPEKPLSKSNLALTISSTSNPAPIGGLFNYVLTVTNRGPDSATDVIVQDFLPPELTESSTTASQSSSGSNSVVWELGDLTKYHSARLVLNVRVRPDAKPGQIANTAYVCGAEVDPDNSNNHATVYTRIEEGLAKASEANATEVAIPDANITGVAVPGANDTVIVLPVANATEVAISDVNATEAVVPDVNATVIVLPVVNATEVAISDVNATEVVVPDVNATVVALPAANATEVASVQA
ncbi:MAG TPA: Ig-like domain-containing protein [Methanothrix sp.]|nr:Ig-like domain-containing protein [Methanothrix sp.]